MPVETASAESLGRAVMKAAANALCDCGYVLPSRVAEHPADHHPWCAYRKDVERFLKQSLESPTPMRSEAEANGALRALEHSAAIAAMHGRNEASQMFLTLATPLRWMLREGKFPSETEFHEMILSTLQLMNSKAGGA